MFNVFKIVVENNLNGVIIDVNSGIGLVWNERIELLSLVLCVGMFLNI